MIHDGRWSSSRVVFLDCVLIWDEDITNLLAMHNGERPRVVFDHSSNNFIFSTPCHHAGVGIRLLVHEQLAAILVGHSLARCRASYDKHTEFVTGFQCSEFEAFTPLIMAR